MKVLALLLLIVEASSLKLEGPYEEFVARKQELTHSRDNFE